MLPGKMFDKLIFPVVANVADKTFVGFLAGVSSLVIVPVANRGEPLCAVFAAIGLFSGVHSHVDYQITSLVKCLTTKVTPELALHIFKFNQRFADISFQILISYLQLVRITLRLHFWSSLCIGT